MPAKAVQTSKIVDPTYGKGTARFSISWLPSVLPERDHRHDKQIATPKVMAKAEADATIVGQAQVNLRKRRDRACSPFKQLDHCALASKIENDR